MTHDAIAAFLAGLVAIFCGLFFGAGAPIALTVAFERVRERSPKSVRVRARGARSRYPYR